MTQDLSRVAWPVRTDRLTFRPATPDDIDATWTYRRIAEVTEWLPRTAPTAEEYAAAFVEPDRLARTLVVEHDGTIIGDLYLHLQDAWAQAEVSEQAQRALAEIGWVIAPAYGGRGLATEAVEALVALCFTELGVRRIQAICFADNEPSWRLMERLGMRREAHMVQESLHRTNGWSDSYTYALLADEWRINQAPPG